MPTHHPEDFEAITGVKPEDTDDEVAPLYVLPDAEITTTVEAKVVTRPGEVPVTTAEAQAETKG